MKSLTAVCQTGAASMPAINANGRITRHPHTRGDGENAEMKMYLSKLKDLVPFMPKNRKLSKLEIIQHVIDYICDLQNELETHPDIGNFDAASALNLNAITASANMEHDGVIVQTHERLSAHLEQLQQQQQQQPASPTQQQHLPQQHSAQQQQQHSSPATRQPLVDLQTPNTILPISLQTQQQQHQSQQQQQTMQTAVTPNNSQVLSTADKDSRQQNC